MAIKTVELNNSSFTVGIAAGLPAGYWLKEINGVWYILGSGHRVQNGKVIGNGNVIKYIELSEEEEEEASRVVEEKSVMYGDGLKFHTYKLSHYEERLFVKSNGYSPMFKEI